MVVGFKSVCYVKVSEGGGGGGSVQCCPHTGGTWSAIVWSAVQSLHKGGLHLCHSWQQQGKQRVREGGRGVWYCCMMAGDSVSQQQ